MVIQLWLLARPGHSFTSTAGSQVGLGGPTSSWWPVTFFLL